jgi:Polyketide cyclase / dehydrase and lipid transport
VTKVSATITVPGRAVEAERVWYDPTRWASWIEGFGHVVSLDDGWPRKGARLVWDSVPQGRGRVSERVVAYEMRIGQTLAVEDGKLEGTQRVAFEPQPDSVKITLALEYRLKRRNLLTPLVDLLFIRRANGDALRRTLRRFASELAAERQFGAPR